MKIRPRAPFELNSPPPSDPPSPASDASSDTTYLQQATPPSMDGASTPSRTRSILNLTSSTLFGIYQPTGFATEREEPSTPWGTGAQTPALSRRPSFDLSKPSGAATELPRSDPAYNYRRRDVRGEQRAPRRIRKGWKGYWAPLVARVLVLFGAGLVFGVLINHLHERQSVASMQIELGRIGWAYLLLWGTAGLALGQTLPWLDMIWADDETPSSGDGLGDLRTRSHGDWHSVVRSITAFVGVAFAVRKLPWQSSLQLSLTLALANPAIWYTIDRSPPGFVLSTVVSVCGTAALLGINPALVPTPSLAHVHDAHRPRVALGAEVSAAQGDELVLGVISLESISVAAWISSVLFVSCICFGNIGRLLAPQKN